MVLGRVRLVVGGLALVVVAAACGGEPSAFGADQFSWESTVVINDGGNEWADDFAAMLYPGLDGLSSRPASLEEVRSPNRIAPRFAFDRPESSEAALARMLELDEAMVSLGYTGRQYSCHHEQGDFSVAYDHDEFGVTTVHADVDGRLFNKLTALAWQEDVVLTGDMFFDGFSERDCLDGGFDTN